MYPISVGLKATPLSPERHVSHRLLRDVHLGKTVLQVLVAEAHDAPEGLAREAGDFGGKVQAEGELDQLRGGGGALGGLAGSARLHVEVSQLLKRAVRERLEEARAALAQLQLHTQRQEIHS